MSTSRVVSAVVVYAASLALNLPALAQSPQAVEFQVNVYTPGRQDFPDVGVDGQGGFVVVWSSYEQDGDKNGVFGRRFGIAGFPTSSEFQANQHTIENQLRPAVAVNAAGDFVVVWNSYYQDGAGSGVFARRFDSSGTPLAAEFQVNTRTIDYQVGPDVAMDADGDFIVVWTSLGNQDGSGTGVFAQRFVGVGTPLFGEFQVNRYTEGNQTTPSVEMAPDGSFIVAWASARGSAQLEIAALRFSSFAAVIGVEFQVNLHTPGNQVYPQIAPTNDGDFVVVWQSALQDGGDDGAFGRRIASTGAAQGGEFQVNVRTVGRQRNPVVSARDGGGFLVVWYGYDQDGSSTGVFMRRFASNGSPASGDLQVNTYTNYGQGHPAVARGSDGEFVVAWSSFQDWSSDGIFAQRFASSFNLDVDADGAVLPLTDGLLILRFLFGFTGNTLVTGAVNLAGCGRCTAPEIEAFLNAMF